jgi:glycosyltransferase involved in cell wall biosynthesis
MKEPNLPKVSFVIPIFNAENLLKDCLESISKQNYPKNKIEIITPDAGSKDSGPLISKKYGGKVPHNSKIFAEPGFMLGAEQATGDLIVYMGSDNRLVEKDWIRRMIKPFADKEIIAAYPRLRSNKENTWLTKYFNAFTDPINHFIFGDTCNPLYFHRAYPVIKETSTYVVYNFSVKKFPMLAFDQGYMIRNRVKRDRDTEYDDLLPVIDLVKQKKQMAYVSNASNFHYTLEKGLGQYSKKMRWIIDNNIAKKNTNYGFPSRLKYLSKDRYLRYYLWPIYAVTIIGPVFYTIVGLIRDRKSEWLYHIPMTVVMAGLIAYEFIRVKILRFPNLALRQ